MSRVKYLLSIALIALSAWLMPAQASTACCPDGGNGKPLVGSTGLGQKSPDAQNLSTASEWSVFQFEKDGIRYVQVNDANGIVRAVAGYIGTAFFALPSGSDSVSTTSIASSDPGEVVYRSSEVEVTRYIGSGGDSWLIKAPDSD